MLAAVDWTNVLVAMIAGLPSIIAAVGVLLVRRSVATPEGSPTIGYTVHALNSAAANGAAEKAEQS